MTYYDTSKIYNQYCEDVLSGKEIAGKLIKLSCQRYKDWFKRDDIEFRQEEVDYKIRIVHKIKFKKGLKAGQYFNLLPFQQFIFANIFGWYYKGTDRRVISNVLIMMARQSGKSYLCAAIALTIAIDKTLPSPTVDYIANSAKQAFISFSHCKDQCESIDPNRLIFKTFRSSIRVPATGASINVLTADTTKLDGRASYFVSDEIHENKNFEIWNILKTGQGSLKNPLALGCSTAGFHIGEEYPLYNMWSKCKRILNKEIEDDTWFAAIFQLDEGDDWHDESVWKKAIPSLGEAVDLHFVRGQIKEAFTNPAMEVSIRTKNLNEWMQSQETWFPYEYLKEKTQHVDLHDYEGEDCFMGVDFSMQNDFSAFTVLIPPNPDRKLNPDKFIFKPFIYIPDQALEISPNKQQYKNWIRMGLAKRTPGNVIDTLAILKDQLEIGEYLNIVDIAFDQYFGLDWQIHAEEEGLPITKHLQSLAAFTPSTDFFELIMAKDQVILDSNPIFLWCFGNVEMMRNERNNNKKPGKSNGDKNAKIDPIIAGLEAITAYNADRGHTYGSCWSITEDIKT